MKKKEHLYVFLMGLDGKFNTVKTQILSTRPLLSLGAASHLVSEDEQQQQISNVRAPSVEAMAFQVPSRREDKQDDKNFDRNG